MFACGLADQKGHVPCVDEVKVFEQILFEAVEAGHLLACLLAHVASNPLVLVSQIRKRFTYTRATIQLRVRNNSKISGSQQDYLDGKSGSPQIYLVVHMAQI